MFFEVTCVLGVPGNDPQFIWVIRDKELGDTRIARSMIVFDTREACDREMQTVKQRMWSYPALVDNVELSTPSSFARLDKGRWHQA